MPVAPIDQPAGVDGLKIHTVGVRIPLGAPIWDTSGEFGHGTAFGFCRRAATHKGTVTVLSTDGLSVAEVILPTCTELRCDGKRWILSTPDPASARSAWRPESPGRPCGSGAATRRRRRRRRGPTALAAATIQHCQSHAPAMRTCL